jgi:hypothetical protein
MTMIRSVDVSIMPPLRRWIRRALNRVFANADRASLSVYAVAVLCRRRRFGVVGGFALIAQVRLRNAD